ncbi:S-layer homology domain-containing protein [Anoxybacillus flavithermus]|uniref:S-layer homology domain-containing protein n=1 Tax=Anoxybacillus flavithermus TaxID=33934 RepID=UPI001868B307|nr:S-layer homology domain-containing protein [Anoxybacillus flavithermus]MBE2917600.1 S-layer homology domain-containing protein [Anoxybacillus flavithermus]
MAYQPKSYRKFLAGTVSAAVVASAIAPVASASFTDVAGSVHADDIATLVAKGYIKGYADGTFKPNKPLTRGEAAIIFSRILKDAGVKAPEQGAGFPDVPASKAELAEAVAIVKAAGVMGGDEKGNFNPNANITREQMAKVVVEAFKLTKPANYTTKITDLDKAGSWAREYIQTLEANGVTKNTEFAPKQNVTRGQFASFVVRAMNVKKEVSAADITAVKLVDEKTLEVTFNGELKEVKKEDFAIQGVEIESVSIKAAAAAEAKTTVVVIKTKTALQEGKSYNVSYKGQTTDKAKVDVPVVTPKVESVSAINLKSFVVNFNKAVDTTTLKASSTAATTDTLRVYNAKGDLVNVTVTFAADKKSAVVVFASPLTQSDSFKVVVDGVKTTDGKALEKYEQTHTATDVTTPEVKSAVVKNSKQIEITFSEPINEASLAALASNYTTRTEFLVDGNPVVAKVTPDYAANKLVLDLTSSLAVGDHKLTVKNVKDFAGFPIASKEFDIKVVSDTAAPQVTSVKVLNKELVQVVFSEPVSSLGTININSVNLAGFAATTKTDAAKLNANEYMKSADGLTYTFRLPSGSAIGADALLNGIKLDYINTTDVEGNKVVNKVEVAAEVSDDTTAPTATVELVAANDTTRGLNKGDILITFSEEMSTLPTVELKDKDGNTVNVGAISFAATSTFGYKKAIVIPASTTGLNNVDGGTYTITVKNAKDNGLRQKAIAETKVNLTAVDTKRPTVTGVVLKNATGTVSSSNPDEVTIYFSEAMDKSSIENKDNYLFAADGSTYKLLSQESSVVSVKAADDNKSVTIKFSQDLTSGTPKFKFLGIKDANGNANSDLTTAYTVSTPVVLTASDLSFELVAKDEVKVKVTKAGASLSNLDPNEVQFLYDADPTAGTNVDTVFAYGTSIKSMSADKKEAVIKLSAPLNADGTARVNGSDYVVKVAVAKVGDASAAAVNTKDNVGAVISLTDTANDANLDTLTDKVAPTLKSATIASETAGDAGNAQIVLTFDEKVNYTSATLVNALVVKDLTDNKVLTVSEFKVENDDNDSDIVITITKSGVKDHKFSVALGNGSFITDVATGTPNAMSPIAETVVKKADGTDALLTERAVAFTATYPKAGTAGTAGSKEVTVLVRAPENGKAYFKVVADGATPPTADAVVADNVSVNVTANTEVSKTLVMAADNTPYDVYVVFVDEAGNKTSAVKVDVTSPAAS